MCDHEQNEAHDHFGPPEIPAMVRCLNCGEEYESYHMVWRINASANSAKSQGFWCCPTAGCNGKGFGLDIWSLDSDLNGADSAGFEPDIEAGVDGLEMDAELTWENDAGDVGAAGEMEDLKDPFAELEAFFEEELRLEGDGSDSNEIVYSDEGWEHLEPEFDHLLWSELEYIGPARVDGLIGDPTAWGFIDPDQKGTVTEYLEECDDDDIPF